MPARKTKKYGRKRKYTRKYRKGGLATKAFVKQQIHKNVETKWYELGQTPTGVDWNGAITRLTSVPQGTTDSQRVGDKLTIRGIHIKYQITTGDSTQLFRVLVVQWKPNTNLITPGVATLLTGVTLGTVNAPLANYVWDYTNQWSILYDKMHRLDAVSKPNVINMKRVNIKYAKKVVEFFAAGIEGSNHVYMVMVSDSGAGPHPTIAYQTRVLYDDA